jgi:hypothetical protein
MLQRVHTRPEPRQDEAALYIRDTLAVLARLADDAKLPNLAAGLKSLLQDSPSRINFPPG